MWTTIVEGSTVPHTTLSAGPELDRLVTERALGWRLERETGVKFYAQQVWVDAEGDFAHAASTWHPSTDVGQAMRLVEGLLSRGRLDWDVSVVSMRVERGWCCFINGPGAFGGEVAETAELAICAAIARVVSA